MKTQIITIRQNPFKKLSIVCLMLFLGFMTTTAKAQSTERTVSGVVKTLDGPLPYTSVVLKGSTIGVTTDENGAFTFPKKLKENDVLIVTSLAYDDYEVTITGDTTFVEPFLEGSPLIIVGALRTAPSTKGKD